MSHINYIISEAVSVWKIQLCAVNFVPQRAAGFSCGEIGPAGNFVCNIDGSAAIEPQPLLKDDGSIDDSSHCESSQGRE